MKYLITSICLLLFTISNAQRLLSVEALDSLPESKLIDAARHPEKIISLNITSEDPEEFYRNIDKYENLQKLSLIDCKIDNISEHFHKLPNLQILHLNLNGIDKVPASIFKCQKLVELNLSSNSFTSVPRDLAYIKTLRSLSFGSFIYGYNQITEVPDYINEFTQLTELVLLGNKITYISPEIGKLLRLQGLYLGGNELDSLPAEIGFLKNLKVLTLEANNLKKIPASFTKLQSLEEFSLNTNTEMDFYGAIEILSAIKGLNDLNLSNNNLAQLPSNLGKLQRLEILNLYGNKPLANDIKTTVAILKELKVLRELNFAYNTEEKLNRNYITEQLPGVKIQFD